MTLNKEYAVLAILEDKIQMTYSKYNKCISVFLEMFKNYSILSKL